jgi:hypothetical protein
MSVGSFAQNQRIPINEPDYNRPKLFANLPDKMEVNAADLEMYFSGTVGQHTSLQLPNDAGSRIEGDMISVSSRSAEGLQTVVIRSTNYNGARMTITRKETNGVVVYSGRVISFQHGDILELKNEQGHLYLVKRNFYDLINE